MQPEQTNPDVILCERPDPAALGDYERANYEAYLEFKGYGGEWQTQDPVPSKQEMCTHAYKRLVSSSSYEVKTFDNMGGHVTWCERKKMFRHFHDAKNVEKFTLGTDPEFRTYHEVINGFAHHKMFFDIDDESHSLNELQTNFIMNEIMVVFSNVFYDVIIDPSDLTLCSSSDPTKISYHIIIQGYYIVHFTDAQYFVEKLLERLPENLRKYIDTKVYASRHNFRLPYNHKVGSSRSKKIQHGATFLDAMITYTENCKRLTVRGRVLRKEIPDFTKFEIPEALHNEIKSIIPPEILDCFRVREIKGRFINFKRITASKCLFTDNVHDHDNTLYGVIFDFIVVLKCRHCKGHQKTCRLITETTDKLLAANGITRKAVKLTYIERQLADRRRILKYSGQTDTSVPLTAAHKTEYAGEKNIHGDYMKDYPTHDASGRPVKTLLIKAQMGAGKTQALLRYLSEIDPESTLMVSIRIAFTSEMGKVFDLTPYSDIEGPIDLTEHSKIIVQCESLYRVKPGTLSVLILDEIESIIPQMYSPTHKFAAQCWNILEHFISAADTVVCMDAGITQKTIDLIEHLRGPSHLIINKTIPYTQTHKITTNETAAVQKVLAILRDGGHVVAPMASCKLAKKLARLAEKEFPEKKIKLYTSETPERVKETEFANVNHYWNDYDLLIYTPVILAGISFTVRHYTHCVAFWYDASADVWACMQMLRRVRSIESGEYYHYVKETGQNHPDTPARVLDYITQNIQHSIDYYAPNVETSFYADGTIRYSDKPRFNTWLVYKARKNYSHNYFLKTLIRELKLIGGIVSPMLNEDEIATVVAPASPMSKLLKSIGDEIKEADYNGVLAARELTKDEYNHLKSVGTSISTDLYAIKKYLFRRFYKFDGTLTENHLKIYADEKFKCRYIRRRRLKRDVDAKTLLRVGLNFIVYDAATLDIDHINQLLKISRDIIAMEMLEVMGFELGDTKTISSKDLEAAIKRNHQKLESNYKKVLSEFGISKKTQLPSIDAKNYLSAMLQYINGKLKEQYGISMKSIDSRKNNYKLVDSFMENFGENWQIKE